MSCNRFYDKASRIDREGRNPTTVKGLINTQDVNHCRELATLLEAFPAVESARMEAGRHDMVPGNIGDDGIDIVRRNYENRERFEAARNKELDLLRKISETRLRHQIWAWILQNNQDGRYAELIAEMVLNGYTSDVYPWTSAYPSTNQSDEAGAGADAGTGADAGAGADSAAVENLKRMCEELSVARKALSDARAVEAGFERRYNHSVVMAIRLPTAITWLSDNIDYFCSALSHKKREVLRGEMKRYIALVQQRIATAEQELIVANAAFEERVAATTEAQEAKNARRADILAIEAALEAKLNEIYEAERAKIAAI